MRDGKRSWAGLAVAALVAAIFMVAPGPAKSETVGVEAKGVSLWAALHNRWNLDVRDELNRPVSGRLIESQLKAASAAAAAESSYASRLPKAHAVALALEMLAVAKFFIGASSLPPPARTMWALPVILRTEPKMYFAVVFLCSLISVVGLSAARYSPETLSLSSCRPLVLRC